MQPSLEMYIEACLVMAGMVGSFCAFTGIHSPRAMRAITAIVLNFIYCSFLDLPTSGSGGPSRFEPTALKLLIEKWFQCPVD
jgi:hypothetical protein